MTPENTSGERTGRSLADSFDRYLQDKGKGRGGDSRNYRRNAAREIERFAEWAVGDRGREEWTGTVSDDSNREPTFDDLDERVFREYARHLAGDRGLKQNTVQTYYRYISAWCGWCVNEGYIEAHYAQRASAMAPLPEDDGRKPGDQQAWSSEQRHALTRYVDSLREPLENLENHLVLQTDEEHFAPFTLNLDVVDGNRRSAYATALARQCRLKSMDTTRRTVSILRAVSSDVVAAAKAVSRLGSEADKPRDLEPYDVRSALSFLDPEELVPDIGPHTVSAVVQCLLDVEESLSTGELATQIGVTTQTLANNEAFFADLEAAGLLERQDLGAGKATLWRLSLPFEAERRSSGAPYPSPGVGEDGSAIDTDRPVDRLAEWCFAASHRDIDYGGDWFLKATTVGGDLGPLLERHPELAPLIQLVLELLAGDLQELPLSGVTRFGPESTADGAAGLVDGTTSLSLGVDPTPETNQTSLAAAD